MATMTFDTLEYVDQLKAAAVPEKQAKVQAQALRRVLTEQSSALASKADVHEVKADVLRLEAKIDLLEQRTQARFTLLQWMLGLLTAGTGTIIAKLFWG